VASIRTHVGHFSLSRMRASIWAEVITVGDRILTSLVGPISHFEIAPPVLDDPVQAWRYRPNFLQYVRFLVKALPIDGPVKGGESIGDRAPAVVAGAAGHLLPSRRKAGVEYRVRPHALDGEQHLQGEPALEGNVGLAAVLLHAYTPNGMSSVLAFRYSGCLGWPSFVMPRHSMSILASRSISMTRSSRRVNLP